jgi:hypothetical protein
MSQTTAKASQRDRAKRAAGRSPTDKTTPDTPATTIPLTSWRPEMSVRAALGREKIFVKLPLVGAVDLPSGPHLVWFAGAAALAALDFVEWPVAVLMMVGKALSDSERSETVRTLGGVMEGA